MADLFSVEGFKEYQLSHERARQLASTYRGTISYTASNDILRKEGLYLRRKEYYNLTRKEAKTTLLNQEEL